MKWLAIISSFFLIAAAGPVFKHKDVLVQDEFKFVYQELGSKADVTFYTPSSSTEGCSRGRIVWDASYVYVCTSTGTWKRSALSSF